MLIYVLGAAVAVLLGVVGAGVVAIVGVVLLVVVGTAGALPFDAEGRLRHTWKGQRLWRRHSNGRLSCNVVEVSETGPSCHASKGRSNATRSEGDDLEESAARALMRHGGRGRGVRGEGRR